MKISASSSIFLATLAISQSSSTLAAPTRDTHSSGISPSPSFHDDLDHSMQMPEAAHHHSRDTPDSVQARTPEPYLFSRGTIGDLVESLPILGPLLSQIVGEPTLKNLASQGPVAAQDIDPQKLSALEAALNEVKRLLSEALSKGESIPSNVIKATPLSPQSLDDTPPADPAVSSSSSAFPTSTDTVPSSSATPFDAASAGDQTPTPTSSVFSSAAPSASESAAPKSPPAPSGPPNTPVPLPISPPTLPITPPTLPITPLPFLSTHLPFLSTHLFLIK